MFQFQTGAIKSVLVAQVFNGVDTFQFQTGAIKSDSLTMPASATKFQFQTGAIKRMRCLSHPLLTLQRFNSKLVRLKGDNIAGEECRCHLSFNSKLVRLKVWETGGFLYRTVCFNSKLVRLKAVARPSPVQSLSDVSIPNWCD